MIDITKKERNIISDILNQYLCGREVMVFGSRASGSPKPYSDLDIAIMGDEKIDFETQALLRDAFEESDLPFRVDILQWCNTSPEFKKTIQPQLEVFNCVS